MSAWYGMRPWVPSRVVTGGLPPLAPIVLPQCTSYYGNTYMRTICL